ncbi:MAG: 2-succinyl-5-enolpyruvyl-6-hydroxy-3-cyclohexene-1-carboxylic-acid synthase [Anaerolineae bacterium]
MKEDLPFQNRRWAQAIIQELVSQSACYFCIAPGSRSALLSISAAEAANANPPEVETFVHFDERGLAYHALGYAKSSQKPAVIIVTSGTAVANLLPAIMEAHHAMVPLIILSADRPPELRDNCSNQATDQVKLFQSFVRWQIDLPCPNEQLPQNYLGTTIAQAVYRATRSPKGPVHLNCMFREPFTTSKIGSSPISFHPSYEHPESVPSSETIAKWAGLLEGFEERGVILLGPFVTKRTLEPVFALAEKLGWPIFADILSPARIEGRKRQMLPYFDLLLKVDPNKKVDVVMQFGDRLVSKAVLEWVARSQIKAHFLVADHPFRIDPLHTVTHRLEADPVLVCEEFCKKITRDFPRDETWWEVSQMIEEELERFFSSSETLSEPYCIEFLKRHLNANFSLFLSNSMPVRDADQFFFPAHQTGSIYCNRGLSGIDGNIATAAGIGQGMKKPTFAVLGDLATLHDINSLAQLKKSHPPVICLVFNNGGGAIFSFFPHYAGTPHFETMIAAAHPFTLQDAASLFQLPYFSPKTPEHFEEIILDCLDRPQSCLIEVTTTRNDNFSIHQTILNELKKCSLTPSMAL